MNQPALLAVSGLDHYAAVASAQSCAARVQSEARQLLLGAMAGLALLLEEWLDVAAKVNLDLGRGRQFLRVNGLCRHQRSLMAGPHINESSSQRQCFFTELRLHI